MRIEVRLAFQLLGSQAHGALDDAPRLDDAQDARHGNAADADALGVVVEYLFGCHGADGLRDLRIPLVQHHVPANQREAGDEYPPDEERAEADDGRVFQSDDITQTQYGSSRVDLEHELGFVCQQFAPLADAGGEILIPQTESGGDEVIQAAHQSGGQQRFGLVAALLSGHQYLRGGRRFGEGIFAVHVADEILAERDEEEYAQDAAQQGADEHLGESHGHFGRITLLQDVEGGQGEDGACHDDARRGADGLDDDILAQ